MRWNRIGRLGAISIAGLLGLAGCHDSGSPTEPRSETAVIQGKVTLGTGTMAGTSTFAGTTAAIVVRVKGTDVTTTAGADGAFALVGVPTGNRAVQFSHGAATAEVPVPSILPSETITVDVTVNGNAAVVNSMARSSGGEALNLSIDPDHWNLEWTHSSGQVTAFIRGTGYEKVDLSTIVMIGDKAGSDPLAPIRATREGEHDQAKFDMSKVLDLVADPTPGSVHTIGVRFTLDGTETVLTAEITIVGSGDGDSQGPLRVEIDPDHWNTNYPTSSGWVTVFIRGEGNDKVDPASVVMIGDSSSAAPLAASSASREGNHVRAQFPKNQVLSILDNPVAGSAHVVTIRLLLDGTSTDLTDMVTIVGP